MLKQLFLFLVLLPLFIKGQNYPAKPLNYVTDEANVLSVGQQQSLNTKLGNFEKKTSNQIFVYVTASLNGSDMSSLCEEIFHNWKIGAANKNNGVLVAVFVNDHKFRIQTGYGLEGALPDLLTKRIQDNDMRPYFKNGDYFLGIDKGVDQLIYYSQNEFKPDGAEFDTAFKIILFVGYLINALVLAIYFYLIYRNNAKYQRTTTRKSILTIIALIFFALPFFGALLHFCMMVISGELFGKWKRSGNYQTYDSGTSYYSSSDSSSSSSWSDSSSDSGSSFDGGGGGDSGGGGSSSDW